MITNGLSDYSAFVVFEFIMESMEWKNIFKPPFVKLYSILESLRVRLVGKCKKIEPILYFDARNNKMPNLQINGVLFGSIMTICTNKDSLELSTYIMDLFLIGMLII